MPQHHVREIWREALASRPPSKDAHRGMYLATVRRAARQRLTVHLAAIQFDVGDFTLFESKGHLQAAATPLSLPAKGSESLWLCYRFQGTTAMPGGMLGEPDTQCAFLLAEGDPPLTVQAGKHWAMHLGISGPSKELLLAELPPLREQIDGQSALPGVPVAQPDRQLLESLAKLPLGPFSAVHGIGQLFIRAYGNYARQLDRQLQQPRDQPHIQLYHRALAYIRENYLDRALDRDTIAEALHCSARSLSRAFEGMPATLGASILGLRLHKGRELLRNEPDRSIEQIALMLHFPDGSHFTAQYRKMFHRTPRQERKEL